MTARKLGGRQSIFNRRTSVRSLVLHSPYLLLTLAVVGVLSLTTCSLLLFNKLFISLSINDSTKPIAPPIFVVAGGAPRTGSTFIYNILKVLMRIRDPNLIASSNWMLAKLVPENTTIENYDRISLLRTMGTSILVKVHTAKQYYDFVGPAHQHKFADEVDLLVTGYRDLRDETVSAYKMFAKNRTAYEQSKEWSELCNALIRRRNSLINEAADRVPVVDIRYEDWKGGKPKAMLALIKRLAANIPWKYSEQDFLQTLDEVQRLRTPTGGEPDKRVNWHLSNLMSPRHISVETLNERLLATGLQAVTDDPVCSKWLFEKGYK